MIVWGWEVRMGLTLKGMKELFWDNGSIPKLEYGDCIYLLKLIETCILKIDKFTV